MIHWGTAIVAWLVLLSVAPAAAQDDPLPAGYIGRACGEGDPLHLTFQDGEAISLRIPAALDEVIQRWHTDGGPILVIPWTNGEEHERIGFNGRRRRVTWIRDRLSAAGIPDGAIFVQHQDRLGNPFYDPSLGTIFQIELPGFGRTCLQGWRDRRLGWIERNCLGDAAKVDPATCRFMLRQSP